MEPGGKKSGRLMAWIERAGNKMPHPVTLFLYLTGFVILFSFLADMMNWTATHPTTNESVVITNLLSLDGFLLLLTSFVDNFQNFPVLGVVLILGAVAGLCEKTGLFTTAIKMTLGKAKGGFVVFFISLIGVISNQAGDVALILIPMLAGSIFYGMGRHPLTGIFCAYASVGGGYATSLMPDGWDVIITPITIAGAKLVQPDFEMPLLASYYGLCTAAVLIAATATLVTTKFVEPRLGKYTGTPQGVGGKDFEITEDQARAAKKAGLSLVVFLLMIIIASLPSGSFLRSESGSLLLGSPLMSSLATLIILLFFIPGMTYGICTGQIRSTKDAVSIMADALVILTPFIVMAIVIGQFLVLFKTSNIGQLIAIKGGEFLSSLPLPPQLIIICFLLLVALINILISSGSSKYYILGPIFVPMLMQLNVHPAFIQFVYRIGDGLTNFVTPLEVAFVILLATCQKYDKKVGMGTLFTYLIPYSLAFFAVTSILVVLWMTLGIDIGMGGRVWLNP